MPESRRTQAKIILVSVSDKNMDEILVERIAEIVLDQPTISRLSANLKQVVEDAVSSAFFRHQTSLQTVPDATPSSRHGTTTALSAGVELTPEDRLRARDLRAALLLGKLPDDEGILIDVKVVAKLINISPRTLYRLHQEHAIPEPVRIGRITRWRLAELIEWIDSGCPPRKKWTYSGLQPTQRPKGK